MSIKHKKSTIISDKSDKPKAPKSAHYVSNSELYEEYVKWYSDIELATSLGKPEPPMRDKIAKAILAIAENLAKKANWYTVSHWKGEMIGDAVENCLKVAKNFDINKTKNPFAYFTQISYFSFLRTIENHQTEDYVRHKSMLHSMASNGLYNGLEDLDIGEQDIEIDTMDYNQAGVEKFIKDFEIRKFGQELSLDECAGNAGKRRRLSTKSNPESGIF